MSEQTAEQATPEVAEDQATEATEPEATEEEAKVEETLPPVEEQEGYDDVFPVLFAKAELLTSRVNAEVDWLKAHSSDLLTVTESIEQGDSEQATAARVRIEDLKSQLLEVETLLRSWAMDRAKEVIAERDDTEAISEHEQAHAKARTAYRDYVKVFKSNYESFDVTPYLPEVKNLSRKGSGKGGGGGTRMRGFTLWTVNGNKVGGTIDGEFKSTASDAAKAAGVDLSELQNEYKRLNGDDSKTWPHFFEFEFKGKKFTATREDKDAADAKPATREPGANVSPSAHETTNGTATS